MSETANWDSVQRILCVRLDNMGDVLMSTPAIRALKQASPQRQITLLASRSGAALAPFIPDIDDVTAYDAPWVKNEAAELAADHALLDALRQQKFDAAVIFTVYSQSPLPAALMCRLAGIPRVLAHCRENPYHLISEWRRETEPSQNVRHEVQRQLDLVASVGAVNPHPVMVFRTRREDRETLHQKLAARGVVPGQAGMVVHCGASAPSRRYPAENFADALKLIGARAGTVLLTGDASERSIVQSVAQRCGDHAPMVDLTAELTLGEMACLLEESRLLLSNNTGPVHMAAAVGTPVVDLYALTNPQHTPWMVPQRVLFHDVPCRYCYRSVCPEGHHACLRGVTPESVCNAVLDLLAETGRVPARALAGVD